MSAPFLVGTTPYTTEAFVQREAEDASEQHWWLVLVGIVSPRTARRILLHYFEAEHWAPTADAMARRRD